MFTGHNSQAPSGYVFSAGFPCQPFGTAGKQEGDADAQGRGKLIEYILRYIQKKKPKLLIIENVKNIKTCQRGEFYKKFQQAFKNLKDCRFSEAIINKRDHGLPQNREKWNAVGIRKDGLRFSSKFPEPIKQAEIDMFLDFADVETSAKQFPCKRNKTACSNVISLVRRVAQDGGNPLYDHWIIDCNSSAKWPRSHTEISPGPAESHYNDHWLTTDQ